MLFILFLIISEISLPKPLLIEQTKLLYFSGIQIQSQQLTDFYFQFFEYSAQHLAQLSHKHQNQIKTQIMFIMTRKKKCSQTPRNSFL